jgi:UDP-3-O-[3-hydroxymyristoyl] glucosamine N-acyltransferase
MRLKEIADLLECKLEGDPDIEIAGVDKIETARDGMLTFVANRKYLSKLKDTRAAAAIIDMNMPANGKTVLRHSNPYLAYARALELFYKPYRPQPGISQHAFVASSARIGRDVYIGPGVWIDEEVEIGDRSCIFPQTSIYRGARIGQDSTIHSNVSIRENVQIGNFVIIKNGAVIGSEGFGFAKQEDGRHYKIIQTSDLILEDRVEIGANTTIDRPAVGETRIRAGTKIDNLVQIAHSCDIGDNTIICAQVGMAGSTKVGKNVILSGQVGIAGHLEIGDNVVVTAQSGIPNSVKDNSFISGYPAIDNRTWLKSSVVFARLPDLLKDLQTLQARVRELEKKLNDR